MLRDMPKTFSWRLLWGDAAERVCVQMMLEHLWWVPVMADLIQWDGVFSAGVNYYSALKLLLVYEEMEFQPTWNILKLHSFAVCDKRKVFQRLSRFVYELASITQ